MLFNLAVLHSQFGCAQSSATLDGIKAAKTAFEVTVACGFVLLVAALCWMRALLRGGSDRRCTVPLHS